MKLIICAVKFRCIFGPEFTENVNKFIRDLAAFFEWGGDAVAILASPGAVGGPLRKKIRFWQSRKLGRIILEGYLDTYYE